MAEGDTGSKQQTGEINPSLGMKLTLKGIATKFNNVQHISTTTLSDWLTTDRGHVILLDSRPENEYQVSHLDGAKRVDFETDDINNLIQSIPQLAQGTKPEVYNLEGSIFKWANEKKPMVDSNNQPTVFAHPYNSLWGSLLNKQLRNS